MRVKGVREMILDHGDHVLHVLLLIYFAFVFILREAEMVRNEDVR
jgi:hypothetical protein